MDRWAEARGQMANHVLLGAPWIPPSLRGSGVKATDSEGTSSRAEIASLIPAGTLQPTLASSPSSKAPQEPPRPFCLCPSAAQSRSWGSEGDGESDLVCQVSICGQGAILGETLCPHVDSKGTGIGQEGQLVGAEGPGDRPAGWQESQHDPCLSRSPACPVFVLEKTSDPVS